MVKPRVIICYGIIACERMDGIVWNAGMGKYDFTARQSILTDTTRQMNTTSEDFV